jgi:hypothetical protein
VGNNPEKSFVKSNIPSEILELLGEISINFSYLQQEIISTISTSTSIDSDLIDRLIGRDNFEALISKLHNSVIYCLHDKELLTADLEKEFEEIIKKITTAKEKRNNLITMLGFKNRVGKDKTYIKFEPVDAPSLKQFNEEIIFTFETLGNFEEKIIKLFSS